MSAATVPAEATAGEAPPTREGRVPHAGWRVIAAKELGDHLLSVRFIVLLFVLGLAAAIPLYFTADFLRDGGVAGERCPCDLPRALHHRFAGLLVPAGRLVRGHRGASARTGLRLRRDQRRTIRGDPAAAAGPADLPRRRDQRQVRRRSGGHRARPAGGHRGHRRLRHLPARHRARVRGGRAAGGMDRGDVRLRRVVAGLRTAAVRPRAAGGHVGPDRLRGLVRADDLRWLDPRHRRADRSRHSPARPSRNGSARRRPSNSSAGCCPASCIPR